MNVEPELEGGREGGGLEAVSWPHKKKAYRPVCKYF